MKVIFVLINGMRYDTAIECMAISIIWLNKKTSRYKIRTEIPTLSRIIALKYVFIITGYLA